MCAIDTEIQKESQTENMHVSTYKWECVLAGLSAPGAIAPNRASGQPACFLARGSVTAVRVLTGGIQNQRTKDVPGANTKNAFEKQE